MPNAVITVPAAIPVPDSAADTYRGPDEHPVEAIVSIVPVIAPMQVVGRPLAGPGVGRARSKVPLRGWCDPAPRPWRELVREGARPPGAAPLPEGGKKK